MSITQPGLKKKYIHRKKDGRNSDLFAESSTQHGDPASKAKPEPNAGRLRFAVLLNSYRSRLLPAIRAPLALWHHTHSSRSTSPLAAPRSFPNPDYFDLIVLGGSNVDPRRYHDWILEVHEFVRRIVRDYAPTKLLGICWSHQTINRVFGGKLMDAAVPEGWIFFHKATAQGSFKLEQHYRREVAESARLRLHDSPRWFGFDTLGVEKA
ncbi:hypothetical protein F5Y12DRAFT_712567 [Xylaria sp. FL1777]|nr:hypothetical protein F5Y12DRAFT_712567 [Xylaria sp. FL1777]